MYHFPDSMQRNHVLTLNDEMLQKHSACLYMKLEPREVADIMFQSGHFSSCEHDEVTECNQKTGRWKSLLTILKDRHLYTPFLCTLQCLNCISVLDTLQNNDQLENDIGQYLNSRCWCSFHEKVFACCNFKPRVFNWNLI